MRCDRQALVVHAVYKSRMTTTGCNRYALRARVEKLIRTNKYLVSEV